MMKAHALVIGGSIAGMLAARILSDHFERVTILDRDYLPDSPEPRKGVPQAAHIHVLLRRGILVLEQLLPDLDSDLAQAGALNVNWMRDLVTFTPAGWSPRFNSDFTTRTCSRGLLEQLIRRRVAAIKNVTIEPRCEALKLASTGTQVAVTGLKVQYRDQMENNVAILPADLVVDASGRSSRGLDWLTALGYSAPEETTIEAQIGYVTRVYQRPANFKADWKVMIIRTRPPFGMRGGVIYPIENNLWMVNLGGAGDEQPPTSDAPFLEFTRKLIHPALYEAVQDAEPVSAVHAYRITGNRLRHFERLTRWPDNFIVLGDAACTFNPIYGQGMTVAALEALALDKWLRSNQSCLEFEKELVAVVRAPWLIATSEDARQSRAEDSRLGRFDKFFQNYFDEFLWLCSSDRQAFTTFMAVSHLVEPPSSMFRPTLALKVMRRMLRHAPPQGKPTDPIPQAPNEL